ncbi:MAG: fasciclin domain-containing protein [Planctomycetota bacterium]
MLCKLTIPALVLAIPSAAVFGAFDKKDSGSTVRNDVLSIVETAAAAGNFKTLIAAVKAAGLVETLQGNGPFTVFAPTDEAFAKLPKEALEGLLKPEAKEKLASILKYHVVSGKVTSQEVVKIDFAPTVEGGALRVVASKEGVMVDGARVVKTDIACRNGIIHVIDTVVMPRLDLAATADKNGNFKTLLAAAGAAGLAETLKTGGPFTVFAPNDEAFAKLPKGTVEELLKPENKEKLVKILKSHIVSGRVLAKDAVKLTKAPSISGYELGIEARGGSVMISNSKVIATDVLANNGVIHVIDSVILP